MKGVNAMIRGFLSAVEVPLFSGAVLAILVVGELNFWSEQVYWQTEKLASIGRFSLNTAWENSRMTDGNMIKRAMGAYCRIWTRCVWFSLHAHGRGRSGWRE
jgi:hypothetical protein